MRSRAVLTLLVVLLASGPHAYSWGYKGHRIVGTIATRYLTPEAKEQVRAILGHAGLADVANWADAIRDDHPETAPWHYVNVAPGAATYDDARDCTDKGCVVSAMDRFVQVLKDEKSDPAAKRDALRWIAHLVGDLHQPLHCAHASDKGGNDVKVTFEGAPTNLHSVWDTEIIERQHLSDFDYAKELLEDVTAEDVAAWQKGGVRDWVNESWRLAEEVAYKDARGVAIASGSALTRDYVTTRTVVVDRRLKQAGVRLAFVLNEIFKPAPPPAK